MSALRKNVASQVITFNLVNATTGAALTGATVTTKVALDGTQSAGGGTVTELGTGQYKYVPTQAETNGTSVGFSFTATNAVPVNIHCFTANYDTTAAAIPSNVTQLLGTAWLTPAVAGTPDVNSKQIGGTAQTARDIGASVLLSSGTGTGQISLSSGLVSLSGTQTFNVTGNITGNLSGSVGSVTGAVGSVTGAVGSVTGNVGGNVSGSVGSVVGAVGSVTATVNADVVKVNGSTITGSGTLADPWGP